MERGVILEIVQWGRRVLPWRKIIERRVCG
jgi:hypothetical protein